MNIFRVWIITCKPVEIYMTVFLLPVWILNHKTDIAIALFLYDLKSLNISQISCQFQMGIEIHTKLLLIIIKYGWMVHLFAFK